MHKTPDGNFVLPRPPQAARSIKMGVKQHFTGSLVIGDDEGWEVEVESHTEMLTGLVMLARRDVESLENQVPFSWIDREEIGRTHFFDFRVSLRDGTRVALIVKNARKAAQAEFQADTRCLASQVTPQFADKVSLITEKHLDSIEVHNAKLIHCVRHADPASDAAVSCVLAGINDAARISDIAAASVCGGSGFRAVVRLIRNHELELVTHERIEPASLVRRRHV